MTRAPSLRGWIEPLALLLFLSTPALSLEVPPLTGRVVDRAGVIPEDVERRITDRLAAYEQRTGHQVAVLTVPSLEGDPIEDFSVRVVEAWRLGTEGRDDGMLLLLAVQDREVRVEVGYGLEGAVPDVVASRVIREVMVPRLRQGDYAAAVDDALDVLLPAAAGEAVGPAPATGPPRGTPLLSTVLVLLLIVVVTSALWMLPRVARALLGGAVGGGLGMALLGSLGLALLLGGLGFALGLLLPRHGPRRRGAPVFFPFGVPPPPRTRYRGGGSASRGFGGFSGGGGRFGGGGASGRW